MNKEHKFEKEEIRKTLEQLNESDLRQLLVLTFRKANLKDVEETHGVVEFGKDIVFYEEDSLDRKTWTACVVKAGDIKQTGNVYNDVLRQISECFDVELDTLNHGRIRINNVLVITNGVFKPNVKTIINQAHAPHKQNISYWDITKLVDFCIEQDRKSVV